MGKGMRSSSAFMVIAAHRGSSGRAPENTLAAFRLAVKAPHVETPPPRLSAHTDEILSKLGYSKEDIAAFRQRGVV